MAEIGSSSSASSTTAPVDSSTTRAPSASGSDDIKHANNNNARPENTTYGSLQRVPTRHEDLDFFDKERHQELARKISRQQSRSSTHTQDPTSDEFDFKQHLRHVLNKGEKEGIKHRQLGVAFENLTVTGDGAGLAYGDTFGSIMTGFTRIPQAIRNRRHPMVKHILKDFTGVVQPGEMILVLGRPGSGCTSLLKTLTNNTEAFRSVEGDIEFEGASADEMRKHHAGDIAYLPEDDHHLPLLTVGQTLDFAAATRTPASGARLGSRQEAIQNTRDVLVSLFGLRHTLNTKVGNDIVRGVSGGERKRVSIAELMTTGAKITAHDNSSRGLDASTALEYVRSLRIATDIGNLTTIVSIYQCGEHLYEHFDKICLIYAGRMVYFGPRGDAVQYFIDMGYKPQPRQTSADFLVAVTDPLGRFYQEDVDEKSVPKTADEMAAAFEKSELGKRNHEEVRKYKQRAGKDKQLDEYKASAQAEKAKHVGKGSPYQISYAMMTKLCIKRRFQMNVGDSGTLMITSIAAIFQALIIGSVYFQMPKDTSGFFSRGGVIFFAILYNSFTGMAEITTAYSQRPIVVRHRQYAMARPSADVLALNLVDIPFKLITIIFFDVILYFMSGLQYSASQFFVFLLFTYITNLAMLALFRALASANRFEPQATMQAGIVVLIVAIYVGYAIPRPSMHPWFRWLSYAQPVSFGFESLLTNEFRTLNVPCAGLIPSGPAYPGVSVANQVCTTVGSVAGEAIVTGSRYLELSYGYKWSHTWRNFGFVFAYMAFFLGINLITTEYQRDESASGGVMVFKRGAAPKELTAAIDGSAKSTDLEKGETALSGLTPEQAQEKERAAAAKLEASEDIFTWKNLNYDVPIKSETRRLLNGVSGYVTPGKMTALMGESGAGKTTLLNVLAQRVTMGVVTGDCLVNGKPLPLSFQRQTGYVQQQDVHMATTTVREALVFSALLRQPAQIPKAEKLEYVEEIIRLLEMEPYAEALVGEVGMGLNVEQRKRLTIAVELAAKPALLIFLDEPSSGLDSQSSWAIMQLLRKLADNGQAILATIHQPSAELFQVFDRLLLLKKGGEVVYQGELGNNSETLVKYFHQRTDLKCGPKDNPAEYILEAIGAGAGSKADKDWHGLWKESEESRQIDRDINEFHKKYHDKTSAADASPDAGRRYAARLPVQLREVITRAFQHYWRDTNYVMGKLALNIVAGLFIGFSFWKAPDSVAGLQNKLFAVFMSVVIAAPLSQQLQPKFIGLRQLWTSREQPSRMYSWPVLVTANILVEIPWNICCGTIFFLCYYWTVGFPTATNRAGYHYLMYMLFELYFASFAQWVAAFSANAMISSVLFSTFFSFVIVFNGVVQPPAQLPYFWRSWMYRLTPFTYLIEGLLVNAVSGSSVVCKTSELTYVVPPAGTTCEAWLAPYIATASGYSQVVGDQCGFCQYSSGDEFLSGLLMSFSHRWRDVGFMCAYIVFNIATVFLMTYLYSVVDWSKVSFKRKKSTK